MKLYNRTLCIVLYAFLYGYPVQKDRHPVHKSWIIILADMGNEPDEVKQVMQRKKNCI